LRDPRLTALLESHALAHGLDPRVTPASAAVLPYMEHAFGTWYVRGGIRELARAVYERCVARRVEFVFGAEVTGIVEKDGRAAGVELADSTVSEADHVVAGVDPVRLKGLTEHLLQDEGDVRPDTVTARPGRFTVLLALHGAREAGAAHRTIVHTPDRSAELDSLHSVPDDRIRPTVTVLRPDDPALWPDRDHEAVVVSAVAPAEGEWTLDDTAERFAARMLSAAETAVPGLSERLIWREVFTPDHIEEETGAAYGAVPAPALAGGGGRFLHPGNTTRLPGLYLVGGWAHPGGGLPHAGMSGALVSGLIVEGPQFRGSQ
jgi:phytoene dehydrogenase-like protein